MRKIEKQLFVATAIGDIKQVKDLIVVHGVNVNVTNPQGITALMVGAKVNNVSVVRLLLKFGADTEKVDYLGRNATAYALKYGAEAVLIELIGYEEEMCDAC